MSTHLTDFWECPICHTLERFTETEENGDLIRICECGHEVNLGELSIKGVGDSLGDWI